MTCPEGASGVGVGVFVNVADGVNVWLGVNVMVGVNVSVDVFVGVAVGVVVNVGVCVNVAVFEGVREGVWVDVGVAVAVAKNENPGKLHALKAGIKKITTSSDLVFLYFMVQAKIIFLECACRKKRSPGFHILREMLRKFLHDQHRILPIAV